MLSSTAAQEVGGAVLAAGKTQLALTVSDVERTSLDHYRNSPAKTATVMQWVSCLYTHLVKQLLCISHTHALVSYINPCNQT